MSRSFNPPKRAVGDHVHAVFSDICWTSGLIRRYDPVFVFMAATSQQRDFVSELCVSSWSNLSTGLSWGSRCRCRCCLCSQFMERQLFVLWLICICAALWESIIFCFGLICNNTPWNNNVVVARSRLAQRPEPHHPVWCDVNHSPVWSSIIPQPITFDLFSDIFECVLLMMRADLMDVVNILPRLRVDSRWSIFGFEGVRGRQNQMIVWQIHTDNIVLCQCCICEPSTGWEVNNIPQLGLLGSIRYARTSNWNWKQTNNSQETSNYTFL